MDKDKIKAFSDKVFADMAGAMISGMGYVGTKTGLFRAMAGKGPMRLDDVVRETGLQPRYVEEWLKGMTCARYVDYDPSAQSDRLPDEHAFLLASDGTDHFIGSLFSIAPVLFRTAPKVADAFAKGGGVRFRRYRDGRRHCTRLDQRWSIRTSLDELLAQDNAGCCRSVAGGRTRSRCRVRGGQCLCCHCQRLPEG
jgi:hypothetical protein